MHNVNISAKIYPQHVVNMGLKARHIKNKAHINWNY